MAPKCGAEALSTVPKHKAAVLCLPDKTRVADELQSRRRRPEPSANEPTVCRFSAASLNRNTHETRLCMGVLTENVGTRGL